MTIRELRKSLNLSQEEFAAKVGLTSKSYVSELENPELPTRCSVKVALEIEKLSGGRISAASLNPDVGLVRSASERPAA